MKNQMCQWTPSGDSVVCTGECPDNQLMHDVLHYAEWVRKEVESSNKLLNEINSFDNPLIVKQVKTNLSGDFLTGDYKLTVSTKRVIELLGSENVYGDSRAFLTELIQNSIDAILVRTNVDHGFSIENGRIDIYIWEDNDFIWTRIDDNGFGMDENIIKNYFLNVGESFYNSFEYKKIRREGNNDFTPLNRFGIGILSCFMNQSDVQLEVETKNINNENVYRMNITSLEGFYSLYEVDRTSKVVPMSAPPFISDLTDGYNRDFGTSICVKHKKKGKDNSVERYTNYIDEHIALPLFDFNIYISEESRKFAKKTEFIDAIEKLMNGRKYKNLHDYLEVYYLNNLEDFFVTSEYLNTLDASKLKDVKVIVVRAHDEYLAQIDDIKYSESYFVGLNNSDYQRITTTLLEKWFIENEENFDPNEREIIEHSINTLNYKSGSYITYNGIAIPSQSYDDMIFAYCIVNGSWFENVDLSKTNLLGMNHEVEILENAIQSVISFESSGDTMPYEVFEAVEQKVLDSIPEYSQIGYIEFIMKKEEFREFMYSEFFCLTCLYNLHIKSKGDDEGSFIVYFDNDDRVSRKNSEFRYSIFNKPICVFEDDNTTLQFCGMLNYNYPLIKWILSNCEKFNYFQKNKLLSIKEILKYSIGLFSYYPVFYRTLVSLKDEGCEFFDDEILNYMEYIKDNTGIPTVIDEF